jgi:hypothetical protein
VVVVVVGYGGMVGEEADDSLEMDGAETAAVALGGTEVNETVELEVGEEALVDEVAGAMEVQISAAVVA